MKKTMKNTMTCLLVSLTIAALLVPVLLQAEDKVNLNTATQQELSQLKGIGPAIAQRIIDYRTQNGPFKAIEDIKKVKGFGDKTFDGVKDLISVGQSGT